MQGGSGSADDPAVIIVIGKNQTNSLDTYNNLMAYHGKSGAAENSARDQEFFLNGGLDGRAEALGYDANASISVGDDISTDGLYQEIETYHFVSKPLEFLGVKNVNAPPERYGHILAEHDGTRRYDDKGKLKWGRKLLLNLSK